MILYFSATGNCKYVAQRVAEATGQEAKSILDCIANDTYHFEDEMIAKQDFKNTVEDAYTG